MASNEATFSKSVTELVVVKDTRLSCDVVDSSAVRLDGGADKARSWPRTLAGKMDRSWLKGIGDQGQWREYSVKMYESPHVCLPEFIETRAGLELYYPKKQRAS